MTDTSSLDQEKPTFGHIEGHTLGKDIESSNVDPAEDARIMRKVDYRLIPILSILYSISLIDRTNISVARVAGMALPVAKGGLALTVGTRYSIISLVFFITYIIFELPSNILLRKIGARVHMTAIVLSWGAVMVGMGFVTDWTQLLALRMLLGIFVSAFFPARFPACLFLITCWYTRYETQRRLAAFYGFSLFVSGFSNIIGYGISLLKGTAGLPGWRWIFIVYGALTMALGIIGFFLIVDFPDKATFLSPAELKIVRDRIDADRGDSVPDVLTVRKMFTHLGDFKLWCFGIIFCGSTVGAYAFSFFLPIILGGAGYSVKLSLILSAPPYVFAFMWVFTAAIIADKTHKRGIIIVINSVLCLVGLALMGWGHLIGVRFLGCFLALAGCQANVPAAATYQANNICSHSKRAVGAALLVGWGGVGGIVASLIYRQVDYPLYIPGISGTMAFQVLIIMLVGGLSVYFKRENARADAGEVILEDQPGFRYTI
ncbi:hypothetical protein RQP46_007126 [Phenoliferia psychrophenolica]